jgi:hypothetical protein
MYVRARSQRRSETMKPRSPRQTRWGSLVEAKVNIVVGFAINWVANMTILPLFGFHVTGAQAFHIGVIFTVISLVRSYVLRRFFNSLHWGHK